MQSHLVLAGCVRRRLAGCVMLNAVFAIVLLELWHLSLPWSNPSAAALAAVPEEDLVPTASTAVARVWCAALLALVHSVHVTVE
jgi:hypothetical protein